MWDLNIVILWLTRNILLSFSWRKYISNIYVYIWFLPQGFWLTTPKTFGVCWIRAIKLSLVMLISDFGKHLGNLRGEGALVAKRPKRSGECLNFQSLPLTSWEGRGARDWVQLPCPMTMKWSLHKNPKGQNRESFLIGEKILFNISKIFQARDF